MVKAAIRKPVSPSAVVDGKVRKQHVTGADDDRGSLLV